MTRPQTVHKYAGDDPTARVTACGLFICNIATDIYRTVDADARRANCGNCVRTLRTPTGWASCGCGEYSIAEGTTMELAGIKHRLDGPCHHCDTFGNEIFPPVATGKKTTP